MGSGQKRKRGWGSMGIFGFRPTKFQVLGPLPDAAAGNESATRPLLLDGFVEGSNSEDINPMDGTTTKIRRTSSRILSFVRFAVVSGMCNEMSCREIGSS